MRFKLVRICESKSMAAVPLQKTRFDLPTAAEALKSHGYAVDEQELMIVAVRGRMEFTLYPNGRLLLEPADDKGKAEEAAGALYSIIQDAVER
jgi:ArsR family metal-binding transcriptional regulator